MKQILWDRGIHELLYLFYNICYILKNFKSEEFIYNFIVMTLKYSFILAVQQKKKKYNKLNSFYFSSSLNQKPGISKIRIGVQRIIYTAIDLQGNVAKCVFALQVKGECYSHD